MSNFRPKYFSKLNYIWTGVTFTLYSRTFIPHLSSFSRFFRNALASFADVKTQLNYCCVVYECLQLVELFEICIMTSFKYFRLGQNAFLLLNKLLQLANAADLMNGDLWQIHCVGKFFRFDEKFNCSEFLMGIYGENSLNLVLIASSS